MHLLEASRIMKPASSGPTHNGSHGVKSSADDRTLSWELFLASFLALFLELVLIRWVPSYERVLAYFTNFVLISAFLGLGVGGILSRYGRRWLRYQALFVVGIVLIAVMFNRYVKTHAITSDTFYSSFAREAKVGLMLPECLAFFFLLIALFFVPLGQTIGSALTRYNPPLRGYVINLLGSLAGVVGFTVVSLLGLGPAWWFAAALAGLLWFVRAERKWLLINSVVGAITVAVVWDVGAQFLWTPYNKVSVRSMVEKADGTVGDGVPIRPGDAATLVSSPGFTLAVNDDFYQAATDLSPRAVALRPALTNDVRYRELAYSIPDSPHDDVLVVGAGTGNDTAAALRRGAKHVDSVEIDPGIFHLGVIAHPERPYSDSRVQVTIDDARSFFNKTQRKYDRIVFGVLDAHRLFSSMSSVRLDSFVYTMESFRETRRLLKDTGVVVVQHALGNNYLDLRMYCMLARVFEMPPVVIRGYGGTTFMVGPGVRRFTARQSLDQLPPVELATDDWPFFYMAGRLLPTEYRVAMEAMALISLVILMFASHGQFRSLNLHFFFLGSAFLLIETVSVTRFAMLFGSTWVVNSIVFTAILLVVLLANLWMARIERVSMNLLYLFLAGAVLLNYAFPFHSLLEMSLVPRLTTAMILMALPIFFAAFIFARSYKETPTPDLAFASNLLGAVVGGLAEYSTLVVGFRAQLLIALGLYALSFFALSFHGRRTSGVVQPAG